MLKVLPYSVYIMSNLCRTVLYIGVTGNLQSRVWQHKINEGSFFTSKYKCHYLLYFENFQFVHEAIAREKAIEKLEASVENGID